MDVADVLARLPRVRVLVVGDVMLDEYLVGECSRVSAEAPVPIVHFTRRYSVPGGAANTAANVAALGGRVTLIGGIRPTDRAGRRLVRHCARAHVDFLPIELRQTLRKVRVIGNRQQLLRLDFERPSDVPASTERTILDHLDEELCRADIVVVSDYAKGLLTPAVCRHLILRAHALGRLVIVDPRPQHAARYVGCDVVTPNWDEAQALLGTRETSMSEEAIGRCGRSLATRLGCSVLLTLGDRGMAYFDRAARQEHRVMTSAKAVFDVTGAGDTVVAMFALALAVGCDHRTAVGCASQAAGVVVSKRGTSTVTPRELLERHRPPQILPLGPLRAYAAAWRNIGKRLVTVSGALRTLGPAELRILHSARQRGDILILGLLGGPGDTRSLEAPAGPRTESPTNLEVLLGLRAIDYVHIGNDAEAFLDAVKPDSALSLPDIASPAIQPAAGAALAAGDA